ncbi:hypothetical protein I5P84_00520 [Pseudomonas mosselii]|uniref:hypothetical protein n=1 Tax=Pseudomonas mosselii TaxID=78327 RepID=UPI0018D97F04|nr:hypothetical protein [Pseudomonas mosselii]MBH3307936.1 hypothetical protein [Pseudomonas mosselii]MBH3326574.1 hypothetical protein [Pseudomonas mosselii]
MFVLVMRDGSRSEVVDQGLEDAMRTLVRQQGAHLEIAADPPRQLPYALALQELSLGRPGLFERYSDNWQPPSPDEFRELLRLAGLGRSGAGRLVGVSPGKIGKWAGGQGEVPYAVWRLLTVYAGLVPADVAKDKEM